MRTIHDQASGKDGKIILPINIGRDLNVPIHNGQPVTFWLILAIEHIGSDPNAGHFVAHLSDNNQYRKIDQISMITISRGSSQCQVLSTSVKIHSVLLFIYQLFSTSSNLYRLNKILGTLTLKRNTFEFLPSLFSPL